MWLCWYCSEGIHRQCENRRRLPRRNRCQCLHQHLRRIWQHGGKKTSPFWDSHGQIWKKSCKFNNLLIRTRYRFSFKVCYIVYQFYSLFSPLQSLRTKKYFAIQTLFQTVSLKWSSSFSLPDWCFQGGGSWSRKNLQSQNLAWQQKSRSILELGLCGGDRCRW